MTSSESGIEGLRTRACTFPTDAPEADGTLAWDSTTIVLVEARAEGCVGTGWTYAPRAAAVAVEDLLASVVVGRDPRAPVASQAAMVAAARNAGHGALVGMAISAVDIALWDLCARLYEVPLTRMFGGPVGDVQVYGSGGFTTCDDDQLRRQLEHWLRLGLSQVKIKVGEDWGRRPRRDLDRAAYTRDTVGDDIEVFVDANGAYAVGQACRIGRAYDDLGVAWFEEPVSSDDLAGLATVRAAVAADVAAGEYADDATYVARMAAGAVDCLQLDVTRCGGYTGWIRCAAVAAGHQLDVSGHCAPSVTIPIAAATPNLRHLEYFHDHVRIERMLFDGAEDPVDGRLVPNAGPGHGLAVRGDVLDSYRVA
jgi:L-alanine-DL-glutamate epimerase-like enolase superfamily enzyme